MCCITTERKTNKESLYKQNKPTETFQTWHNKATYIEASTYQILYVYHQAIDIYVQLTAVGMNPLFHLHFSNLRCRDFNSFYASFIEIFFSGNSCTFNMDLNCITFLDWLYKIDNLVSSESIVSFEMSPPVIGEGLLKGVLSTHILI